MRLIVNLLNFEDNYQLRQDRDRVDNAVNQNPSSQHRTAGKVQSEIAINIEPGHHEDRNVENKRHCDFEFHAIQGHDRSLQKRFSHLLKVNLSLLVHRFEEEIENSHTCQKKKYYFFFLYVVERRKRVQCNV